MTNAADNLNQIFEELKNAEGNRDALIEAAKHAQEMDAFAQYGPKARAEHVTYVESVIPGYIQFECDTDVYLGLWGIRMGNGPFFVKSGDHSQTAPVYRAKFDGKRFEEIQKAAEESGEVETVVFDDDSEYRAYRVPFGALEMEPIEVEEGHYLTFIEYVAWLAITTADTPEIANAIFLSAYNVEVKEPTAPELPKVSAGIVNSFKWPTDKVNGKVWKLLEGKTGGNIDVARKDRNKPESAQEKIPVTYSIDFSALEGLTISRKLTPYDRRVYLAAAALFDGGYSIVSLQQIYNQMGNEGDAGKANKRKISESLTKMSKAWITIDNIREHEHYNKRGHFRYHGALLPMEVIEAVINGNVVESAIHILKEPALLTYAAITNQIATVDVKYLNSPLNKNDATIELEDYLIYRISRIKRKGSRTSNKIRFETIYDNAGITTPMQRRRALEKLRKLLDFYKQGGFIDGFKIVSDGVEILYDKKKR